MLVVARESGERARDATMKEEEKENAPDTANPQHL